MIIYPTTNYTSFCSLADAETIILEQIPYAQRKDKWTAIADISGDLTTNEQKEVLLRQSTTRIKLLIGTDNLPDTLEDELKQACAILANHSVNIDMTNESGEGNLKRKRIEGVVEKEYFSPSEDKSNDLPDSVMLLLSKYSLTSSGSFVFNRA